MGQFVITKKLLRYCIVFLIFCSGCECHSSCTCKEHERNAILNFTTTFMFGQFDGIASWGHGDCCYWEGVRCDNVTCNIIGFHPFYLYFVSDENKYYDGALPTINDILASSLTQLKKLSYLDLRYRQLSVSKSLQIPHFTGSMKQLRYLNLKGVDLAPQFYHQLSNLTNLQSLILPSSEMFPSSEMWPSQIQDINWVSSLQKLQRLDLSGANLSQAPPNSIQVLLELPFLQELTLASCQLTNAHFHQFFFNSTFLSTSPLQVLDFSNNLLHGPIPSLFANLSSLTSLNELDLSHNHLSGPIPPCLGSMSSLLTLLLSNNHFNDTIPSSLMMSSSLQVLDISTNSISGIGLLSSLEDLVLSSNNLTNTIPSTLEILSSLNELDLSYNHLSGPIPPFLGRMSSLASLDLSNNHFNGTIPSSLMMSSSLLSLDLSNNDLTGVLLEFAPKKSVPLSALNLDGNHLAGAIPKSICHFHDLGELDLKANRFSGRVPICLWNLPLLYDLNLSNNTIEGELPSMIKSKSFERLDLGENHFYGEIPLSWEGRQFKDLQILRLRSNNITGTFPPQMCSLYSLRILDVANNHLSGGIPECFGSFSGMQISDLTIMDGNRSSSSYEVMKGAEREYKDENLDFLFNLDLSGNNLSGPIPAQLTWLNGLIGLNLNHNQLTGPIPSRIDNMTYLESLDLSNNNIRGSIPQSLGKLTFLSYLNLSHNKLHGPIPTGSQLQTLTDPSIYAGNVNLCGDILSKKCTEDGREKKPADDKKDEDEADEKFEKLWLVVFTVFGGITGFWGVIGILLVKRSWRYAYFRLADIIAHWIGGRWIKKVK